MIKQTKILIVILLIAVTMVISFFLFQDKDYNHLKGLLKTGYVMNKPLPSFSLVDQDNKAFNKESFKGRWSLLYFGYTHCPDVCPTELLFLSQLKSYLEEEGAKVIPNGVFITLDPSRDIPAVLKIYMNFFDSNFIGLSGEQSQIDNLVKAFGSYYEFTIETNGKQIILKKGEVMPQNKKSSYLVNHTSLIYLVSPNQKIFAAFPPPRNITHTAKAIELLIERY